MSAWLTSDWTVVVGAPLLVAVVGAIVSRTDIPRWRAARVEETARLLTLASQGSHDEQLLRGQLAHQLAQETDRREVRRRAGWLMHAWWMTSLTLFVAALVASRQWTTAPRWWDVAFSGLLVLGIGVPNGRIGRIEMQVRRERQAPRIPTKGHDLAHQGAGSSASRGTRSKARR